MEGPDKGPALSCIRIQGDQMIAAIQFDAWYVAKTPEGVWDFVWSTKLPVLAWDRDEHGVTGYVQAPSGDGSDAAYLVPANDALVNGSDGRQQFFVRYMPHA